MLARRSSTEIPDDDSHEETSLDLVDNDDEPVSIKKKMENQWITAVREVGDASVPSEDILYINILPGCSEFPNYPSPKNYSTYFICNIILEKYRHIITRLALKIHYLRITYHHNTSTSATDNLRRTDLKIFLDPKYLDRNKWRLDIGAIYKRMRGTTNSYTIKESPPHDNDGDTEYLSPIIL